ncbi:hypothetical protein [Actinokineospora sp. NPDC004072]
MITSTAANNQQHDAGTAPNALGQFYTDHPSWPTMIDSKSGEVRLRLGETVDALVMPAGFGGKVNHELVRALIRPPIIVVRGKRAADWVFLTQPRPPMRRSTIDDLMAAQVVWPEPGDTVLLPPLAATDGRPRWLQRPRPGEELPGWAAVIGAVRRVVTRTW